MYVYFISLFLVSFFLMLKYSRKLGPKSTATFVAIILIFVAGFRYHVGRDYWNYAYHYYEYIRPFSLSASNIGLRVFAWISKYIYNDYATFFFLMAAFTVGLCVRSISKYSTALCFSILLYILIGCWHGSFNVVKQSAATAILFACQCFIHRRQFVYWLIACLAAAAFHISALLMIPLYFLVIRPINKKQLLLLVIVGLVVSYGYEYLFSIFSFLKRGDAESITAAISTRSVSTFRVLVNTAPALLVLYYYKDSDNEEPAVLTWANFSLLNTVFYIACRNSVYMIRFCLFTEIYNILLVPYLVNKERSRVRWILKSLIILLYFAFWSYDLYKGSTTATFYWIFDR